MERYVYETARALAERRHQVSIMCRAAHDQTEGSPSIETLVLPTPVVSRGWQDRCFFARAVSKAFDTDPRMHAFDIIHSHENTTVQNVSTEHGPCTLAGLRKAPWKFSDYSAIRNLLLERAKFGSNSLSALVCCSAQVEKNALTSYPRLQTKLRAVITPAYSYLAPAGAKASRGFTLGFVGADWRRKGLVKALEAFRILQQTDPRWTMVVAGVEKERLPGKLLSDLPGGVGFPGRVDPSDVFAGVDILIHPAREEPFGMVIAEALSLGVPAVISDRCGCAAHIRAEGLKIVGYDTAADGWAAACLEVHKKQAHLWSQRTWADVAADYERLYERVLSARQARLA
jgi:UDP-glucose:(heptosyl)LPS alpha-1,3-glucosyltransferase